MIGDICYLCGSASAHVIHKGTRGGHDDIDVLRCDDCGLVRLSHGIENYENFYRGSGMREYIHESLQQMRLETRQDDERRYRMLERMLEGKTVLDYGCGDGGFLVRASKVAASAVGVELEDAMRKDLNVEGLECYASLSDVGKFDIITMFHVIEHLDDAQMYLLEIASHLAPGGKLIIETPNANDALLSLYNCSSFADFTYWHCHLYLYSTSTLSRLARKTGYKEIFSEQLQRYPLSNSLYWLSKGRPGGHFDWSLLSDANLDKLYGDKLAKLGIADTLFAIWTLREK